MVAVETLQKYFTIAEYLEMEDASEVRHEFHNGNLKEMAGGILPHNAIKLRFGGMLDKQLDEANIPHMALNSDTKVRIEAHNRFVYPDVTISDGTPEYYTSPSGAIRRDTVINPLVVIEVLSEDTRAFDKGEKFELYSTIPSFREYVLIEPEAVWAKSLYLQDPENKLWRHEIITDRTAPLIIHSLGLSLSLDEIYKALDKLPK
jgi:Uma2 family endonuclease